VKTVVVDGQHGMVFSISSCLRGIGALSRTRRHGTTSLCRYFRKTTRNRRCSCRLLATTKSRLTQCPGYFARATPRYTRRSLCGARHSFLFFFVLSGVKIVRNRENTLSLCYHYEHFYIVVTLYSLYILRCTHILPFVSLFEHAMKMTWLLIKLSWVRYLPVCCWKIPIDVI
jgi:hypothetical protein